MLSAEKRVPGIDLLRGLCIVAVVLHHINLRIPFHESMLGKHLGQSGDQILFWNGYYGVRVFFVISGFLIASWSLKRWGELRKLSLRQFYSMRFARIVPCLIGLLALLALLDRLGVPRFTINTQHTSLGRALLAALTFHVNWLEARTGYLPAAWDVLWSLSVEEVFYLLFPLLCVFVRKQSLLIAMFLVFVVAGPIARVMTPNGIWSDYSYMGCMDGIAFGCLAALLAARFAFSNRANLMLGCVGAGLAILITCFRHTTFRMGLSNVGLNETVLGIGIGLLLIALQQHFGGSAVQERTDTERRSHAAKLLGGCVRLPALVLQWYGRNSYEVYLTHMLVVWPMVVLFQSRHLSIDVAPIWFLSIVVIAGLLGQIVSRYYSEPLNRVLRRRLLSTEPAVRIIPAGPSEMA